MIDYSFSSSVINRTARINSSINLPKINYDKKEQLLLETIGSSLVYLLTKQKLNKMKRINYLLFLTLIVACAKVAPDYSKPEMLEASSTSYKVSEEEAFGIIEDFLASYSSSIQTKGDCSLSDRKPLDITALRCSNFTTKSSAEPEYDMGIDTLMYAINFADEKGFALISADKRTEPILAIIEDGCFNEDELCAGKDDGFLIFLERAVNMMHHDILEYNESPSTKSLVTNGYTITSQYGPLLHSKWDQEYIYGSYCPNGIGGCVAIATAQILSYYQTPNSVSWSSNGTGGSATLHWSQIIADCDSHNGKLTSSACATSGDEIAHLVRYLGLAMNADYNSNSTSIGRNKAIEWFNNWSSLSATSLSNYNQTSIVNAIKNGKVVYARGNAGRKQFLGITLYYTDGHAWVYDGTITATKNGSSSVFIHCNWGWHGYKNGYYLSNAFDTTGGATIYDSSDYQSGSGYNFQYNLEYSIISQ